MKPNRNIWLMYIIALLQGMVFYGPIAVLYRQAAGISIFQITVIESISLALSIFLELPWGILADRIGYKRTMTFCCVIYVISKIIFWKAENFGAFLAERLLLSVVVSGLSGVDSSILYLSCREGKSQRVFGIYNNLQTLGMIFASGIYSLFIKTDYRLAGFLTVCSYGLAAAAAFGLKEVRSGERKRSQDSSRGLLEALKKSLGNKYYLSFLAGVALLNETHQTITVFINQLQYRRCGLTDREIGWIFILVTLGGLLGVFSEKLTPKWGVRGFTAVLYLVSASVCFLLGITKNGWISAGCVVLLRISFSLFQPLHMELQNRQIASKDRATCLSMNSMLMNGVGIGTNLVYGKLAEKSIALAMGAGGVFCLAGLFLFCLWYGKYHKSLPLAGGAGPH